MIARDKFSNCEPEGFAMQTNHRSKASYVLGIYRVVEFLGFYGAYMSNQEMASYADRSPLPAAALRDRYEGASSRRVVPRVSRNRSRPRKSGVNTTITGRTGLWVR